MDQPAQPLPQKTAPVQELPHLVVGEPKRSPWGVLGVVVLSLVLLAIPVGVYLVNQRTQVSSQAASTQNIQDLSSGIILESKASLEGKQGIIPVDIYVKSQEPLNLVNAKIKFDSNLLVIDKIATDAASIGKKPVLNKWLKATINEEEELVSIVAGTPQPGLLSSDGEEGRVYLATLFIRALSSGTAVLQIDPSSQLFRNIDNQNILQPSNDLVLSLPGAVLEEKNTDTEKKVDGEPLLVITSPIAVTNYSYFQPVDIVWSSFGVDQISQVNLYLNGDYFGPLKENLEANAGKLTWNPQDSISFPYIQPSNTYQIEVVGVSKNGAIAKVITGPFGILGQETVVGTLPNLETFYKNQLSIDDASRLLTGYLAASFQDKALDFNGDEIINELDFFLLKQNLLQRGLLK